MARKLAMGVHGSRLATDHVDHPGPCSTNGKQTATCYLSNFKPRKGESASNARARAKAWLESRQREGTVTRSIT
jgi:hypothetical protein